MRRRPRRGAALLLAMLVLTLVGTLAAGMVWQQWRALQVEAAERNRAQAARLIDGGVDLARVVLRLDNRKPGPDHGGESWAAPVKNMSVSSLLVQTGSGHSIDVPEAYLGGDIRDAQSRYNLRNLLEGSEGSQRVAEGELAVLRRLCASAGVDAVVADTIATGLLAATQAAGGGAVGADTPLAPRSVEQLTRLGLDAATVQALRPYVEVLPEPTPLNLNTAERDVLAAVIPGMDSGSAERLVSKRPFDTLDQAREHLPQAAALDGKRVGVSSRFFEATGRIRMDGRVLEERVLLMRHEREVSAIARQRQSLLSDTN